MKSEFAWVEGEKQSAYVPVLCAVRWLLYNIPPCLLPFSFKALTNTEKQLGGESAGLARKRRVGDERTSTSTTAPIIAFTLPTLPCPDEAAVAYERAVVFCVNWI